MPWSCIQSYLRQTFGIQPCRANNIVPNQKFRMGKRYLYHCHQERKKVTLENRHKNFFYHAFTSDTVTRPSCYQCRYATIERVADLTMGDYWGSKQSQTEINRGISLLIVNNIHGQQLVERCTNLHTETTHWDLCLPRNPRLYCDKHECKIYLLLHTCTFCLPIHPVL